LLVIAVLPACGSVSVTPELTEPPSLPVEPSPVLVTTPTPSEKTARIAIFTSIANDIQARPSDAAAFTPALLGQELSGGAEALSGEDSRARLDLQPEGTIVRLGPNTLFSVEDVSPDPAEPFTKLKLLFGQLWVILNGGEMEVETPLGTAAVRGSYMSVAVDPLKESVTVTCLEGQCVVENDFGSVELTDGQASGFLGEDTPPSEAREMFEEEFDEWFEASPEAEELIQGEDDPFNGMAWTDPPPETMPTMPLEYQFTNACDGTDGRPSGEWVIRFERQPDEDGVSLVEQVYVAPGETVAGLLPAGWYLYSDITPDGEMHGPDLVSSDMPILLSACVSLPAVTTLGEEFPIPPTEATAAATTYTLVNNCADVWFWQFIGAEIINFTIQPWETITGTLPPGDFEATDWRVGSPVNGPNLILAGGDLYVEGCPSQP
jgi:hypothetical protein